MVKATAPLSPRQVLGNRQRSLSLEEASAALVAMLSGVRKAPPRRELRKIAGSVRRRQDAAKASRKPQIAALAHELHAAICVWVDLPLQSARTRKASGHVAALEEQLASLKQMEAHNGSPNDNPGCRRDRCADQRPPADTARQDEIESIVTRIARPMSDIGEAARRAQWNAAVGAANAAWAKYSEVEGAEGKPEEIEAREKIATAMGRLVDECAKLIFREPVRNLADIVLLAEVCFYTLWSMDWSDPEPMPIWPTVQPTRFQASAPMRWLP
jgi:hypothetical protein